MSNNIYNNIIPVPQDPNTVHVETAKVEFMRDYILEYNEVFPNKGYSYEPLLNTNGVFPKVEFTRKDPLGYMKIKGANLWLHENGKLYFDYIRQSDFYYRQPLVLWFEYVRERECIAYRYRGYGVEKVMKKIYDNQTNVLYINYKEENGRIVVKWVEDRGDATKFVFDKIKWNELGWIKLHDKDVQKQLLSR